MGIRLVVVDDNPHLAWNGRTYPANATFEHFVAALLDLPGAPVASIVACVPLRDAEAEPSTRALDPRLEVVGTAPFDGIAGYLRHALAIRRQNQPVLEDAIGRADLLWLKIPASNAALAASVARRQATPRFGWVAGSARAVGWALPRALPVRAGAAVVGLAYDLAGSAAAGPNRIVVGRGIVAADGVIASLVRPAELNDPAGSPWMPHRPVRLAWAGRVASGKGLGTLLELLRLLPESELAMLGDGPARPAIEAEARRLGVAQRIDWKGYVADRSTYLTALAESDVLVHPSRAEGFPKVVLDAMAVGLPVVASPAGSLRELAVARLLQPVGRSPARSAGVAIMSLLRDQALAQAMRERAYGFAGHHTASAEAERLVDRLRAWFPDLPWP